MFVAFQRVYTLKQRGHIQSETWFLVEQRGADHRSIDSACVSHQHETCNGPDIRLKHFIKPSVCSPLCSSVLYTVVTGSTTRSLMMSCSPCVTRQQNKDLNQRQCTLRLMWSTGCNLEKKVGSRGSRAFFILNIGRELDSLPLAVEAQPCCDSMFITVFITKRL